MSTLEFPLFGPVTPGGEYETTAPFNGQEVPVRLDLTEVENFENNRQIITSALEFFAHWEKHLTTALTAIDGNPKVIAYLEHHLQELDRDALGRILHEVLREGEQPTIEKLATTLVLTNIWSAPSPGKEEIGSIDFSLGKNQTHYTLKAGFNIHGEFTGFEMES